MAKNKVDNTISRPYVIGSGLITFLMFLFLLGLLIKGIVWSWSWLI